ncbi:MAG: OB-fold domain-containing protein, partial [Candidatus Binatia bacterium]
MIAQLSGTLSERTPTEVVIDVGGVGYQLFVSVQTYQQLPPAGSHVDLLVHTHVREDAIQL